MILVIAPSLDDKRIYAIAQLSPGGVHRSRGVIRHASGKGANAARALARRGEDVLLCAPAGDALRALLEQQLAPLGVRLLLTPTRARTRCCVTVLEDDGRATELVEEALPIEEDEGVRFMADATRQVEEARALLIAGSLPPGISPDFPARCARRAAARGVPVVIDAQGAVLLSALPASNAVVKINREEFNAVRSLLGARGDAACAAQLRALGASAVVVTDGGAPVRVWIGKGRMDVAVPAVRVVNPIGSGDAMSGGLTAALAAGASLVDAVNAGIAFGVANARTQLPGEV